MRRMTVVSILARCDTSSNEHSGAAAFLTGGWQMDRFCRCVPSHLSEYVCELCTRQFSTPSRRRQQAKIGKGLPFFARPPGGAPFQNPLPSSCDQASPALFSTA
jgi:hypothetical protein